MGRLTNPIGLRLGKNTEWVFYGAKIKKSYCIANLNFIENLSAIIYLGKLQDIGYLLAKVQLIQEKKKLEIKLFFYLQKINFMWPLSILKYKKLLYRYKYKKLLTQKSIKVRKKNDNNILQKLVNNKKRYLKKKERKDFRKKIYINKNWLFNKLEINKKSKGFKYKKNKLFNRKRFKNKEYAIIVNNRKFVKRYLNKYLFRINKNKKRFKQYRVKSKYLSQNKNNNSKVNKLSSYILKKKYDYQRNIYYKSIFLKTQKLKKSKHNEKGVTVLKKIKHNNFMLWNLRTFLRKIDVIHLSENLRKNWSLINKQGNFVYDSIKILNYYEKCGLSFLKEELQAVVKKLDLIFFIKNKEKILKTYIILLLSTFLKKNKKINPYSYNVKSRYLTRYVIKQTSEGINDFFSIYKVIYKLDGIYKKKSVSRLQRNFNFLNKKTMLYQQFACEFLLVEKMVLELVKMYFLKDAICNFYFIDNYNYTAQLLVKYICIKLKQRFTLTQVLWPLLKFLDKLIKKQYLLGYRVEAMGRFTRKQRATVMVIKKGSVSLGTTHSEIDYSENFVRLKDGVGGIKVWLTKTKKLKNYKVSLKSI